MSMTTLVFIGLAAFIIWRLYNVLGTRTGNEQPPREMQRRNEPKANDNVVYLPKDPKKQPHMSEMPTHPDLLEDEEKFRWTGYAEEGSELAKSFEAIYKQDPDFHPRDFIDGAKMAYEMIVTSFASGDKTTLKPLLSDKVYQGFAAAIDSQVSKGLKTEMTFIGVQQVKITEAKIDNDEILLTTRISSESISTTMDEAGHIVEGDPNTVEVVTDIWTFSRPLKSGDPSWYLVATRAG